MSFRFLVLPGLLLSFTLTTGAPANAIDTSSVKLGFSAGDLGDTWQVIEFPDRKPTVYEYRPDTGTVCARASSSAAGLARDFPRANEKWSTLSWEWKTDGRIEEGNARQKSGDDYAGRVYVNYRISEGLSYWERFKLSTYETIYGQDIPRRSINFVWANVLEPGTIVPSPYTDRVKLVSLRDREAATGTWVKETVNLQTYYERIYDSQYDAPHSLAIMTDTDNTEDSVRTCYRNIRLTK